MQPIISVKNITKKFKEVVAVDDVSFDVDAGEIFAFLGPNAQGKHNDQNAHHVVKTY